jgi:L-2-hydroxyglutarate oxidase
MSYDVTIVGAGIVGLSTAYKLTLEKPDLRILILEKESEVAAHQTGNNSGVIHSGIYYKPGSYKARNCVDGRKQLVDFCQKHDVKYDICGKVIVATDETQLPSLHSIYERGRQNEIEGIKLIDKEELAEIEPYANGVKAIKVPVTGIVDFKGVCEKEKDIIDSRNGEVKFNEEVTNILHDGNDLVVQTRTSEFKTRFLINCAGLHCDHVAEAAGFKSNIQIVPFRGEYYELTPEAQYLVKGLIYPLPNPEFPFLGVHFTRMVLGGVECGPNAVFAFKREGYNKVSFDLNDTIETFQFPGFWKLAYKHWRMGLDEMYRSFSKQAFLRGLQQLVPAIQSHHIQPAPAGVRAMALDHNGEIVDDFYFVKSRNEIHVLNAPSPAATAGLSLGDEIVDTALKHFELA